MKTGKLLIGTLAATVFFVLTDMLWFGMLMKDHITPMPNSRPEPMMVWLILGMLIYSLAFTYIFMMGRGKGAATGEGARFGFWATLMAWVPLNLVFYGLTTTAPLSEYLVDIAFRLVQMMIMGVIVAHACKSSATDGKTGSGGDD